MKGVCLGQAGMMCCRRQLLVVPYCEGPECPMKQQQQQQELGTLKEC